VDGRLWRHAAGGPFSSKAWYLAILQTGGNAQQGTPAADRGFLPWHPMMCTRRPASDLTGGSVSGLWAELYASRRGAIGRARALTAAANGTAAMRAAEPRPAPPSAGAPSHNHPAADLRSGKARRWLRVSDRGFVGRSHRRRSSDAHRRSQPRSCARRARRPRTRRVRKVSEAGAAARLASPGTPTDAICNTASTPGVERAKSRVLRRSPPVWPQSPSSLSCYAAEPADRSPRRERRGEASRTHYSAAAL
jgi:hypothetical protein